MTIFRERRDRFLRQPSVIEHLHKTQKKEGKAAEEKGSWEHKEDRFGSRWGSIGQTALSAIVLAVCDGE